MEASKQPSRASSEELGYVPKHEVTTQAGVSKVEAVSAVWGPKSKAFLWFGVACISYVYSLDGSTTYTYLPSATSSYSQHSALASVSVAQAIILAVTKPFAAKISDTFGRAEAFIMAVVFYVVGFIIVATSDDFPTFAAGSVIYYIGYAATQILIQIVVADLTTLRWRTIVQALTSFPYFINFAAGALIADSVLEHSTWHWGYAMFCFIIPAGAAPIIVTLLWGQWKAKMLGLSANNYNNDPAHQLRLEDDRSFFQKWLNIFVEIDAIGLLLIGAGLALILLPLTIVNQGTNSWDSPSMVAMIVVGFVVIIAAVVYEGWWAKLPVVPGRFLRNTTVLCAGIINLFDFISFYLQFTYQYSFIDVVKNWSVSDQNYFSNTQNLTLTLFAFLAGAFIYVFRRGKWLLVGGLALRMLGVGLMIHSKGANGGVAELVIVQMIQGAGGGLAAGITQTSAQSVVPHQDVAAVTAFVLLCAEVGNAIGTAIAGAIWREEMPPALNRNLNGLLSQSEITEIFGSITVASEYPQGGPVRNGIIDAYTHVMTIELIPATVLSVIPLAAAFFVKNVYFGDTQNIVEDETVPEKVPAQAGSDESTDSKERQ